LDTRQLLHIYLEDGNIDRKAKRIDELEGVTSIEIHWKSRF
jgi:hypothetical protein